MQISFVKLIFLLFSDQISGGQSLRGGRPPVEESQDTNCIISEIRKYMLDVPSPGYLKNVGFLI